MGVPWKREIVANLESGRRAQLDVTELLALAVVFDVPPAALLVPAGGGSVAVTPTVELDAHHAVLWLLGEEPIGRASGAWLDARHPIDLVRRWHQAIRVCRMQLEDLETNERLAAQGQDVADRLVMHEQWLVKSLREVRRALGEFRALGLPPPQVPEPIAAVVAERSFDLTGTE